VEYKTLNLDFVSVGITRLHWLDVLNFKAKKILRMLEKPVQ